MVELPHLISPVRPNQAKVMHSAGISGDLSEPADPPGEQFHHRLQRWKGSEGQRADRKGAWLKTVLPSSFGSSLGEEVLLLGVASN